MMISRKLVMVGLFLGLVSCASLSVFHSDSAAQEAEKPPTASKEKDPAKETITKTPETQISKHIDSEISKVWKRDGIEPAKPTTDVEFVRRVYLDTVGVPPMPEDIRAFLSDKDKNKRSKLIDKLVDSPRFGEHMGDMWTNILVGRATRNFSGATELFAVWIAERINTDPNFSNLMYDIITASGKLSENPAVAVYMREVPMKISNVAGHISKTLAGTQIQCAECHDHPYEAAWTEEAFAGVASFFSPMRQDARNGILPRNPMIRDDFNPIRIPADRMKSMNEDTKKRVKALMRFSKPITLDGVALKTPNRQFWRPAFAKWLTRKQNKQTASYIANRFWSFTFGSGILNPIDDFNSFNEASHPELLEFLGEDLIDNDYDIKRLYRAILKSKTYQLSSIGKHKDAQRWHFAAAPVRQLSPEQFFGAFVQIAGGTDMARAYRMRAGDPFERVEKGIKRQMRMAKENKNPNQRKVTFDEESLAQFKEQFSKISDTWFLRRSLAKPFATLGEDDEMTEADNFSVTIDQALSVLNGDIVDKMISNRRGTLVWRIMNNSPKLSEQVTEMYEAVLGREPSDNEHELAADFVRETKDRTQGFSDLMFALLATTEFQTNH